MGAVALNLFAFGAFGLGVLILGFRWGRSYGRRESEQMVHDSVEGAFEYGYRSALAAEEVADDLGASEHVRAQRERAHWQ